MKKISCGILIYNGNNELFLCHSTGNSFWDVPKGLNDEGESFIETAIRELKEETGFIVTKEELKDLGEFKYNSSKNLYLFEYIGKKSFNEKDSVCTSYFEHFRTKKMLPEVDKFEYMSKDKALTNVCKSMNKLLEQNKLLKGM